MSDYNTSQVDENVIIDITDVPINEPVTRGEYDLEITGIKVKRGDYGRIEAYTATFKILGGDFDGVGATKRFNLTKEWDRQLIRDFAQAAEAPAKEVPDPKTGELRRTIDMAEEHLLGKTVRAVLKFSTFWDYNEPVKFIRDLGFERL